MPKIINRFVRYINTPAGKQTVAFPPKPGRSGVPFTADRTCQLAPTFTGVSPPLVSQILLRLLDHPDADRALPVTPIGVTG